ncbi:RNA polymerase sigma factor [Urbifossiella limnaea]|uniref:ECF RNA polymerase sigma factor SigE n=1 Tax=Urbifossiella limnaea TaxID=2528023 RepID=A0A517Y0C2_9BACT|nr:RNA polymerase sigma factor [Urbifossiella limnaea]QDU23203.1 ECF RNA polymerase sigma factor SigE [Urbifossiella limnaea]
MPGPPLRDVLRRFPPAHDGADRPDADLIRRYAAERDEAAFEALVRRHGPMVLGVCRRALGGHDAEDAFQATFLVLARKAGALRDRAAVGSWLYGVAANVARRARARIGRRRECELVADPLHHPPIDGWRDAVAVVDDELGRLPAKYRTPIVACALEGQTIREAALALGWPQGTVATRLARGRALLAARLARRGVAVAAALAALGPVPVTAELVARAVRVTAGAVPAAVLALTNEVTRGMFLTKLKAVAAVLLAAGVGVAAATVQPPDAPPKADPPAAKREATAARKLIERLHALKPKGGGECLDDDSGAVLRDLIRLGPAAVPDVVAELDATTDPFLLRCLGYAARGIGDKRVVPALIRALPKTCLPSASDYGNVSNDPELFAFLKEHAHDKVRIGDHYAFGRPLTEFRSALKVLTGTTHGESELNFASLSGSARQQALQREQFHRCAARWAAWWDANSRDLVADPAYRASGYKAPPAAALPPPPAEFPHGPRAKFGGGISGGVLESARAAGAGAVFKDLDTGREGRMPAHLRAAAGRPDRLDAIAAWAAGEGYDLMCTEDGPATEPHYVIRGLGLTAWEVDVGRRGTLAAEVKADGRFEMGRPAGALLAPFDAKAGRHAITEPGLFLFRTREGGYGWLFVGAEVHDNTLQPGGAAGGDLELSPVAFQKGRRYGYTLVWE